jgi:hypothetical protein
MITDDFIRFLVPKRSEVQHALKELYFLSDQATAAGPMSTELEIHGLMLVLGFRSGGRYLPLTSRSLRMKTFRPAKTFFAI